MKKFTLSIVCILITLPLIAQKSLFNGNDLDGWNIHGTELWYVDNGLLVCESGPDKGYGYLSTTKHYDDFDLTLETTHHGPILTTPTLYIEIGSTEDEWVREDVADCWAEVISDVLVMSGGKSRYFNPDSDVMIGFGGGHYAPRHKSVILNSEINIGHIIANYSLVFEPPKNSEIPSGPWSECIQSAVESTRISFPKSKIFAHLDRKSFKGWERSAITQKLEELGIEIRRGKQITQRE